MAAPSRRVVEASRRLTVATVVLLVAVACVPFLVRWADTEEWNFEWSGAILAVALPVAGLALLTLWQQRCGRSTTTFAPGPLSVVVVATAVGAFVSSFLGSAAVLIDVLLLPFAAAYLAIAWVQPRESYEVATALIGAAVVPFAAWFAGRADEYVREGMIAGSCVAALVLVLWLFRRRGRLAGFE